MVPEPRLEPSEKLSGVLQPSLEVILNSRNDPFIECAWGDRECKQKTAKSCDLSQIGPSSGT